MCALGGLQWDHIGWWIRGTSILFDLQLAKAPNQSRVHHTNVGHSTDPVVMSDGVGSQLHVSFSTLRHHNPNIGNVSRQEGYGPSDECLD